MRRHMIELLAPLVGHDAAVVLAPSWFTFVGLAAVVTGLLLVRAARRAGEDVPATITAMTIAYVAAVACGILVPMVLDLAGQIAAGGPVRPRWAGMVSYWGHLGGMVAAVLVLRRSGALPVARFGDLAAAPLGLGLATARLGCFTAGCDYGQVTSAPWALRFPAGSPAWADHVRSGLVPAGRDASLPVHPTQLYEVALGVAMFLFATWLARTAWSRQRAGRVFLATWALYAVGRILIEMLRGDAGRGVYGAVSSAQIFCLVVLAVIGLALWRGRSVVRLAPAATLALLVALPGLARAQQPAPPPAPPPDSPAPAPAEPAPAAVPPAAPAPTSAPIATASGGTPAPASAEGRRIQLGLVVGTSSAINRREGQVPVLGGGGLTGTLALGPHLFVGLDLDSMASDVATHSAILVTGAYQRDIAPELALEGRIGFGGIRVNWEDPAFADLITPVVRYGIGAEWRFHERWSLLLRPLSFEHTASEELGGPIVAYQATVGIAFGLHARRAAPPAGAAQPATAYPPQPQPQPPPQPQPQPQPPQPPPQPQPQGEPGQEGEILEPYGEAPPAVTP